MFARLDRLVQRLTAVVAIAGGLGLLVATAVTCLSILFKLLRRGIEAVSWTPASLDWLRPILGEEELVQYSVALALFAALPYVMYAKGHITVDLFKTTFSPWLNRLFDLLGDIALTVIAYLLFSRQWSLLFKPARGDDPLWITEALTGNWAEIADRLKDRPESQILGIKLWPTYLVAEVLTALFLAVGVFCIVRSARALVRGAP